MADNSLIKEDHFSVAKIDSQTLALKIIGAALNGDAKSLLCIIEENKEKDDEATFCALSGIFFVIGLSKEDLRRAFNFQYHDRDEWDKLASLLEIWESILKKNAFQGYAIITIPEKKMTKDVFWAGALSTLLKRISESIFSPEIYKNHVYDRVMLANKIILIASNYGLVESALFLEQEIPWVFNKILDSIYVSSLSNSTNKIWDAQRAAREYFLRKLVLFNPLLPAGAIASVEKRWRAWFLLEDQHKIQSKPVKRDTLLQQVEEVMTLL